METEDENPCLFRFSFILCSEVPLYYCGSPKMAQHLSASLWELCLSQLSIYFLCFWDLILKRKSAHKFMLPLLNSTMGSFAYYNNKSFSAAFMSAQRI